MGNSEITRLVVLADGQSAHTQRWCSAIAQRGIDVTLITFRAATIPGVRVLSINKNGQKFISPTSPLYSRVHYLFGILRIHRMISLIKPDFVHAYYATSYGLLGALLFRRNFYVSVWGMDITDSPKNLLLRTLVKFVLHRAETIFSTSNFLAESTRPLLNDPSKIKVIPFGTKADQFVPSGRFKNLAGETGTVVIGSTKSFEKKYGISNLISAYSQVRANYPSTKLVLVGSGSLEAELKQKVIDLGLGQSVEFHPPVAHDQIPGTLETFDIYVMPSISASETFGVAALEASTMGLPVIGSRIGGIPEVIEDGVTGFLVKPDSIEALVEALERLLADPELRKKFGSNGRKFAMNNYSWDVNVESLLANYVC